MTDFTAAAPLIGSSATAIAQQSACLPQAQTPTGRRTIRAYVAGSTALMNILNPLEIVAFKLGVTGCSTAFARIEDLRHKRYAGIWKRPDDAADAGVALKSANEWNLVYLQDRHLRGAPLPKNMRLEKGCIVFTVPSRFTADDVNHAVHAQLQHLSLRPALALPGNQAKLAEHGYDPLGWFHTPYDRMTRTLRISAAQELYVFQPRVQTSWLVEQLAMMVNAFESRAAGP